MKIVLCSSEVVPFAKTGGLADVAGALPVALEQLGQDMIVVLPKFASVKKSGLIIERLNSYFSFTTIGNNVKVYFVENDEYYDRPGLYGEKEGDYKDNLLRFSYYCEKTLELLKLIDFKADIIHCNDWQTCLIPVQLKTKLNNDQFYKNIKTVLTIHNLAYQGLFPADEFESLKLDQSLFSIDGFEFYGKISFLKAGILFADKINTVSQGYAREILTEEYGCGFEAVLERRKKDLSGIINGLDYDIWDPATDKNIFKNYSGSDLSGKKNNKLELQRISGLKIKDDIPLLGFVGRLAEQKGINLVADLLKEIVSFGIQVVILGTGDLHYHDILESIAKENPELFSVSLKFDNTLAHRIYAACDMFLMPSRYEPCGLGQLISFKYATTPIACKTGGLADTVIDFNSTSGEGNGFVFDSYDKDAFFDAINRAKEAYKDRSSWNGLLKKISDLCFSWEESAKKYVDLYKAV